MFRSIIFGAFALASLPALASEECHYEANGKALYFVTPMTLVVALSPELLPYACSTYSAGTGVNGRMVACSDGHEGSVAWNDDNADMVFRDETWTQVCTPAVAEIDTRTQDELAHTDFFETIRLLMVPIGAELAAAEAANRPMDIELGN